MARLMSCVSILILLDYLFLTPIFRCSRVRFRMFQSLFYWITYSYYSLKGFELKFGAGFNPYFTGLPILIKRNLRRSGMTSMFQSLFYWITYSYLGYTLGTVYKNMGFNPYFTGLPILIVLSRKRSIYYCYRIFFRH